MAGTPRWAEIRATKTLPLPVQSSDEPRARVLTPLFLVDDAEEDRLLFREIWRKTGTPYPLRLFRSGEEVIDAFISVLRGAPAPLVCFLDVKMTGMSGFDVLRWIRCQHDLAKVPVVMLSSSEEPPHFQEAAHFGAQCYAAKFPSPPQLTEILRQAEAEALAAANPHTFELSCNLLLAAPPATAV